MKFFLLCCFDEKLTEYFPCESNQYYYMCSKTISKISFTILLKLFLFSEDLMVPVSSSSL